MWFTSSMENPLKVLYEKVHGRTDALELKDAERSQLLLDIDKVWMGDNMAEGGYELIMNLQKLPEKQAALEMTSLLAPYLHVSLEQRLTLAGISVGELTPNYATPSGVRGMLRSGSPILLISNESPDDFHRPIEIARAIGEMIYGRNDESVIAFVKAFDIERVLGKDTRFGELEQ